MIEHQEINSEWRRGERLLWGQQQPVAMLSAWWLLSCVNRPFVVAFSGIAILNVCFS